jgi:hypothetical protein
MPTLFRLKGYRFFFSSLDRGEPPHVHVASETGQAKCWIGPVSVAYNRRLRPHELAEVQRIVRESETLILEKWNEHFHR